MLAACPGAEGQQTSPHQSPAVEACGCFSICFEPRGQVGEKLGIHLPWLERVQTGLLSGAQEAGALLGLPHHPHSHTHPSSSQGLKLLPGLRLQTMFASNVFANAFSLTSISSMSVALNRGGILSEFLEGLFLTTHFLRILKKHSTGQRSGERIIASVQAINLLRS